jgi:hypothetical protein
MLVVGALFQITAFTVQFFAIPFPAFALSFTLSGIGNVFQVNITYIYILKRIATDNIPFLTCSSLHLRMASSQLFRRTLNTNRGFYRLHMVQLSCQYFNSTLMYFIMHRRWSIICSLICHKLCSINNILVGSLSFLAFTSRLEYGNSCGSFKFQSQDGNTLMAPIQKYDTNMGLFIITECLRQAGEILPERIPSEEIHENRFSELMKNRTVHLLAIFLTVYTGIETTIGGIIRSLK